MGLLPPQAMYQMAPKKRMKTQANLFVLRTPLSPWGSLQVMAPVPGQPTNRKLSSKSRMEEVLQANNEWVMGFSSETDTKLSLPYAHVTPLQGP